MAKRGMREAPKPSANAIHVNANRYEFSFSYFGGIPLRTGEGLFSFSKLVP